GGATDQAAPRRTVGRGPFLPIRDGDLSRYSMPPERFSIPAGTAHRIERTRSEGGRVVAVGTTTVRALEAAAASGRLAVEAGEASLFIGPGHVFRVVDALLTNFHLPRTPLLALVAAFAGGERTREGYADRLPRGDR